jgi:hypothetical protein
MRGYTKQEETAVYCMRKVNEDELQTPGLWERVDAIRIKYFPWAERIGSYQPEAYARACWTDTSIHVQLEAWEPKEAIRATHWKINDMVCEDSCLEFFFQPDPQRDPRYINLEFNSLGTHLIGMGTGRHDLRFLQDTDRELLDVQNGILLAPEGREGGVNQGRQDMQGWHVSFAVPFTYLKKHFPDFSPCKGAKIKGNFYKCGDLTPHPHYGCWSRMGCEKPDFHRPEYFGDILFGELHSK